MRALVLRQFREMVVEDLPDPTPGPGEVVLRIAATGICGSDIHGFTGANGRRVPGQVMGHESVGHIEALGVGVTGLEVGRPATFNPLVVPDDSFAGREQHHPGKYVIGVRPDVVASLAERVVVPARNVVVLPESVPLTWGALIEPLAVAVHAVARLNPAPGSSALVVGGGPIGQACVLALARVGVDRVVVSEPQEARRDLCVRLGAIAVDGSDVAGQVTDALGGPADVAVDAAGVTASVASAFAATRLGGSVCLVGMGSPRLDLDAYAISASERTLVGSFAYAADDFRAAAAWVADAPEVLGHLVSREVAMADAPQAFTSLAEPDGTPGKVLVRLDR